MQFIGKDDSSKNSSEYRYLKFANEESVARDFAEALLTIRGALFLKLNSKHHFSLDHLVYDLR